MSLDSAPSNRRAQARAQSADRRVSRPRPRSGLCALGKTFTHHSINDELHIYYSYTFIHGVHTPGASRRWQKGGRFCLLSSSSALPLLSLLKNNHPLLFTRGAEAVNTGTNGARRKARAGRLQAQASHLCRRTFASKLSSILRPYFLCSDGSIWLGELNSGWYIDEYDAINFADS